MQWDRRDPVLMLSPHATFRIWPERVVADVPRARVELRCKHSEPLRDALLVFAGGSTINAAEQGAGKLGSLRSLSESLLEAGVLVDLTPLLTATEPEQWLQQYFRLCDDWAADIFLCKFWQSMRAGSASVAMVRRWIVEMFHRTIGADEHNHLAEVYCGEPRMFDSLHQHNREERGHPLMILRGLVASGVSEARVRCSRPLPTTRALIEYMAALAMADTFAYLGCYGILHAPRYGQSRAAVTAQFDHFAALYPAMAPALAAIRDHALIDLNLGHDQVEIEKYVLQHGVPSMAQSRSIIRGARGIANVWDRFFAGLYECSRRRRR
jgi:hypothetical protein